MVQGSFCVFKLVPTKFVFSEVSVLADPTHLDPFVNLDDLANVTFSQSLGEDGLTILCYD